MADLVRHTWLALRNANASPKILKSLLFSGPAEGTRWESDRIIDWGMQNHPVASEVWVNNLTKVSDHKGIWFLLSFCGKDLLRGRFKPALKWDKPLGVTSEAWLTAPDKAWNSLYVSDQDFERFRTFLTNNHSSVEAVLQDTWNCYMMCINQTFRCALLDFVPGATEETQVHFSCLLKQTGFSQKGQQAPICQQCHSGCWQS